MARIAAATTLSTALSTNTLAHTASTVAAGAESGDVYLSYDATKITGWAQLVAATNTALRAFQAGTLKANS